MAAARMGSGVEVLQAQEQRMMMAWRLGMHDEAQSDLDAQRKLVEGSCSHHHTDSRRGAPEEGGG